MHDAAEYRIINYRGKLAAEWYDETGKRHRRSLGTSDQDHIQSGVSKIDAERVEAAKPAVVTVGYVAKEYRKSLEGKASAETFDHQWKALESRFGHLRADDVSEHDCRTYAAQRKRAEWTVHSELGRLRSALSWAQKRGHITKAPHIWRPAEPPPRDLRLTRVQADKFQSACDLPHVKLFVILARTTGARMGALLDLTWDRVDFERRKIVLHDPERKMAGKGRATVPMNQSAYDALQDAHRGSLGKHVIEWGGVKVATVKKALHAAGKRCALPWVTAHVFRHSVGTWLAEDGTPMEEIAQLLGHSDVKVTRKVYARYSPNYLAEAAKRLEVG